MVGHLPGVPADYTTGLRDPFRYFVSPSPTTRSLANSLLRDLCGRWYIRHGGAGAHGAAHGPRRNHERARGRVLQAPEEAHHPPRPVHKLRVIAERGSLQARLLARLLQDVPP